MSADDLGTLRGKISLDDGQFTATLSNAGGKLNSFGKQVSAIALGMIGANSIDAALRTVTNTIRNQIKEYAHFQTGMKEVSTLVDTQKVNMKELGNSVLELSAKYGMGAGGLTKALYQTISAGIDAAESIKFLEIATKAAIGGVTDTATTVNALTSALNAYGMDASKAEEVSDSLFTTVKLGKTTMAELSPVIGQIAPLANAAGVSLDEMNNALATLTLSGLSTSEAGTAIRGMLNALIKPSDTAIKYAKELGLEFNTQAVQAKGLIGFLEDVAVKTGGTTDALSLLFPEVRGLNAALQLTGDGFGRVVNNMDEYNEKAGATTEAAEKMKDSLQFEWDKFASAIKNAGIALTDSLGPGIKAVLKAMTELMDYYVIVNRAKSENVRIEEAIVKWQNKQNISYKEALKVLINYDIQLKKLNGELEEAGGWFKRSVEQVQKDIQLKKQQIVEVENYIKNLESEKSKTQELAQTEKDTHKDRITRIEKEKKANADKAQKLAKQMKEEKEDAEDVAQLIERLNIKKDDIERNTAEAIKQYQIAVKDNKIQCLAEELDNEETTATRKKEIHAQIHALNIKKLETEKAFQLQMLDQQYQALQEHFKKQETDTTEHLKAVQDWYIESSKAIEQEFANKTVKEAKAIVDIELEEGVLAKLTANIKYNFEQWHKSLKDGSTQAWSGLINDTNDTITQIAGYFGGLPDTAKLHLDNLTNLLVNALSGSPVQTALAGLKLVGDAISLTGRQSAEAAREERIAAEQANKAANAFLKSQGKADYTLMSLNEIKQEQDRIMEARAKYIEGATGRGITTGTLRELEGMSRYDQQDVLRRWGFSTEDMKKILGTGGGEGEALRNEYLRALKAAQNYSHEISFDSPHKATSFSGAKASLDVLLAQNRLGEDDYERRLRFFAEKFKNDLTPIEYAKYMSGYAEGGIITHPTIAALAEKGPEMILPLNKPERMNELLQQLGAVTGNININLNITGETGSAERVGEIMGDKLISYLRSKGI